MTVQNAIEGAAREFGAQFDAFVTSLRARGVDLDDGPGSSFRKALVAQRELESAVDMAAIARAVDSARAA